MCSQRQGWVFRFKCVLCNFQVFDLVQAWVAGPVLKVALHKLTITWYKIVIDLHTLCVGISSFSTSTLFSSNMSTFILIHFELMYTGGYLSHMMGRAASTNFQPAWNKDISTEEPNFKYYHYLKILSWYLLWGKEISDLSANHNIWLLIFTFSKKDREDVKGRSGFTIIRPGATMLKVASIWKGLWSWKVSWWSLYSSPRWRLIHSIPIKFVTYKK